MAKKAGLLPFLTAVLVLIAGCTMIEVDLGPRPAPFVEKTITGQGRDKVLLLSIDGMIMEGRSRPGLFPWSQGEDLISRVAEELDAAEKDPDVKALLVKINSPGGTVAASDLLHHRISRFKERKKAKVAACLMGIATSGGYFVAAAADRITALPSTVTGSIGVVTVRFDLSGLMDRYGVRSEVIKSGRLKDMWSPFRPAGEEERRVMQAMIDEMFRRFLEVVRMARPDMTPAQLEKVSTAEILTASQALALGLVDRIAYPEEAFEEVKKLAGLEEARLIVYHRPGAHRPNIYARGPEIETGPDPAGLLDLAAAPLLMYLWLPGSAWP
ncbi:MAG: signal peptide peptidase SppA [Thermodesulfobacteriota bacterium]